MRGRTPYGPDGPDTTLLALRKRQQGQHTVQRAARQHCTPPHATLDGRSEAMRCRMAPENQWTIKAAVHISEGHRLDTEQLPAEGHLTPTGLHNSATRRPPQLGGGEDKHTMSTKAAPHPPRVWGLGRMPPPAPEPEPISKTQNDCGQQGGMCLDGKTQIYRACNFQRAPPTLADRAG